MCRRRHNVPLANLEGGKMKLTITYAQRCIKIIEANIHLAKVSHQKMETAKARAFLNTAREEAKRLVKHLK